MTTVKPLHDCPIERAHSPAPIGLGPDALSSIAESSRNEIADGTIAPRGLSCQLESFRREGLIPRWTWLIGDARVAQRLWMRRVENTSYRRKCVGRARDNRVSQARPGLDLNELSSASIPFQ